MSYQKKCPVDGPGVYPIVKRGDDLKHLSFQLIELGGSLNEVTIESGEEELAVDFYSGPVRIEINSPAGNLTAETPPRKSIREPGGMLYVPSDATLKLTLLDGSARVSVAGALGKPGVGPQLISRNDPEQRCAEDDVPEKRGLNDENSHDRPRRGPPFYTPPRRPRQPPAGPWRAPPGRSAS